MANLSLAKGLEPIAGSYSSNMIFRFPVKASYTGKRYSPVYIDSAGRASGSASSTRLIGIQMGDFAYKSTTGAQVVASSSAVGDFIEVLCDPNVVFYAQVNTGALADPYTTAASAGAFDLDLATAGGEFIDSATSTLDEVKIIAPAHEPGTGAESAVGANMKGFARFNHSKHAFGGL